MRNMSRMASFSHFKHAPDNTVVAQAQLIVCGKQILDIKPLDHDIVEELVPACIGDGVSGLVEFLEVPPARHIEVGRDYHVRHILEMTDQLLDLPLRIAPVRRMTLVLVGQSRPVEMRLHEMDLVRAEQENGVNEIRLLPAFREIHNFMPHAREVREEGVALVVDLRAQYPRRKRGEQFIRRKPPRLVEHRIEFAHAEEVGLQFLDHRPVFGAFPGGLFSGDGRALGAAVREMAYVPLDNLECNRSPGETALLPETGISDTGRTRLHRAKRQKCKYRKGRLQEFASRMIHHLSTSLTGPIRPDGSSSGTGVLLHSCCS